MLTREQIEERCKDGDSFAMRDSHLAALDRIEALSDERDTAIRRAEAAWRERDNWESQVNRNLRAHNAATRRAEVAEAERDAAIDALKNIVECWDVRADMYTQETDVAGIFADKARAALAQHGAIHDAR